MMEKRFVGEKVRDNRQAISEKFGLIGNLTVVESCQIHLNKCCFCRESETSSEVCGPR